jgi:hypothetical protein
MGKEPGSLEPGSQQRAFLAAFRKCGNVRRACEAAGVARSGHCRWLEGLSPMLDIERSRSNADFAAGPQNHVATRIAKATLIDGPPWEIVLCMGNVQERGCPAYCFTLLA